MKEKFKIEHNERGVNGIIFKRMNNIFKKYEKTKFKYLQMLSRKELL